MSQEELGLGQQFKHKNLQKIIKKVQSDPKLQQFVTSLSQTMTKTKTSNDPKDKIKEKLRQCRLQRGGKNRQMTFSEKHESTEAGATQEVKVDMGERSSPTKEQIDDHIVPVVTELKNHRKRLNEKIKKLEKKLGTVTNEMWMDSIRKVSQHEDSTTPLRLDQLNHEKMIIELYNRQTASQLKEETLLPSDLEDLDESNDYEDIDSP